MNAPPEPAAVKRWPRRVVLALAAALVVGGVLLAYLKTRPSPVLPEVALEAIDPDLASAIVVATEKVRENPRSEAAWGFLCKLLLANGLDAEANVCLRQLEKLDAKDPRWPYYRALANLQTNTDQAIASSRRAIEVGERAEPGVTAPHKLLATILIQEGRNEEADEILQVVRAKELDSPQTVYLSALLLANRNDLPGSIALLRRLIKDSTTRLKACTKLSQLHLRLGDSESARKWDKIARKLPPDDLFDDPYANEVRQFWVGREQRFAEVARLEKLHRYVEALALLEAMVEDRERTVSRAHVNLGKILVRLARGPEAERAFSNALLLSSDDAETYNCLALVRLFQGEERETRFRDREGAKAHYLRALDSAQTAVRINPYLGEAQMTLGQIRLALGERKEGIAALRECLRTRPQLSNALLLLGEALAKDGQPVEARQHLRDALRFADRDEGRYEQALERFEKEQGKRGEDLAP